MMCMAAADFVGAFFWFADVVHSVCPEWMVLNLYGYQAAQMWSCMIGVYLVLKFSERHLPPEILFHMIGWGVPILPQAIIIYNHMYRENPPPQGCWLEFGEAEMIVVAIPQAVTVVLNSILLTTMFLRSRNKRFPRMGFRNRERSLLYIQISCLITTFAGVLQSIPDAPQVIYDISFVLGASQGFINVLSMRQHMVFRFFRETRSLLHRRSSSATASASAIVVTSRVPARVVVTTNSNMDDNTPETPILKTTFGSYQSLPSSEIN